MREFRAYIKSIDTILDVVEISWYSKNVRCVIGGMHINPSNGCTEPDFDFPLYDFDDIILIQSTGLHDKNGVEIFEGDIVQATSFHSFVPPKTITGVVKYHRRAYECIDNTTERDVLHCDNELFQVLGNIHETPGALLGF